MSELILYLTILVTRLSTFSRAFHIEDVHPVGVTPK